MSVLIIDITRKAAVCRFARTLGSTYRLTAQITKLQEYADSHDMTVVDTVLDYDGGSNIDRVMIEGLYEGVEKRKYKIILVTHSNRIACNEEDVEMFCERIRILGGKVYSIAEGYI